MHHDVLAAPRPDGAGQETYRPGDRQRAERTVVGKLDHIVDRLAVPGLGAASKLARLAFELHAWIVGQAAYGVLDLAGDGLGVAYDAVFRHMHPHGIRWMDAAGALHRPAGRLLALDDVAQLVGSFADLGLHLPFDFFGNAFGFGTLVAGDLADGFLD